jgi:outer membrane immunogenic protein
MRFSAVGLIVLILASSSGALAQGIPGRPGEEPFAWTGLYVGVNAGYGWGRASTDLSKTTTIDGVPSTVTGNVTVDVEGGLAGAQIGHNWRSQRWIYGVEADFQWTGQDGDISGCSESRCATLSYGLDWFGTVRGRLGYLLQPRSLLYVTGGLAYGHISTELSTFAPPGVGSFNNAGPASDSATKAGWVIGGGLEWAFDRKWTLRAEYLYMDLGTIARAGSTTTSASPAPGPECLTEVVETKHTAQTDFTDQIFRIGLSYRFAEPYTPLK